MATLKPVDAVMVGFGWTGGIIANSGVAMVHKDEAVLPAPLTNLLMGAASSVIARLLNRFRWIAWIGLAIILYVAVRMVYEGADQVLGHVLPNIPFIKGPMPLPMPVPLPV